VLYTLSGKLYAIHDKREREREKGRERRRESRL
jgi:hypothetical protein